MAVTAPPRDRLTCSKCREAKTEADFHKSRQHPNGIHLWCLACRRDSARKRWAADPAAASAAHIRRAVKHRYGITWEQYEALVLAQNGKCGICGGTQLRGHGGRLCIDHDHATGRIRGLLCTSCNLAVGYLADSAERAEALAAYLRS